MESKKVLMKAEDILARKLTKDEERAIDKTIESAVDGIDAVWDDYQDKNTSIGMAVLETAKSVVLSVEDLTQLGLKGTNKKQVAMTIVETVIDEQNFKFKILGIPVPFVKKFIKKKVMKYAEQLIDWLVDNLFNRKK